jgi:uncharacterized membrane protein YfhO
VLLEEAPPDAFKTTSLVDEASSVQFVSHTNNDVTLQAQLTKPGFLVLSELYYPGWEVTVDGKSSHIYSADGALRAVALEAGDHKVEFHFRPTLFFVSLLVALVTVLTLVAAVIIRKVRHSAMPNE